MESGSLKRIAARRSVPRPAHSPQFGFHLQKRCKELGLFCEVLYDRAPGYKQNDVTAYLIKTLTATPGE